MAATTMDLLDSNVSWDRPQTEIEGPSKTCYEGGIFKLSIDLPQNYPHEPPVIRFQTPIYHPNIDDGGRICLDILNSSNKDPHGERWSPARNIYTALTSIRYLMQHPNPDDPLMADIVRYHYMNLHAVMWCGVAWRGVFKC